jgi:hypothetical protein
VLRDYNKAAEVLAKAASGRSPVPHGVLASDQHQSSVCEEGEKPDEEPRSEVMVIDEPLEVNLEDPDWQFPILERLVEGKLPSDQTEARRIAHRAKAFVLIDSELYKRGTTDILMRCIPRDQGRELLQKIHVGTCGHHVGPRTLVGKAFRQGFYWSTALADSKDIVRRCEVCQLYARQTHLPAQALQTIPITWPFAFWNLDMVDPLRQVPGGFTHLLVAVDKFSKWIEARPIVNICSEEVVSFFTDIIYRFCIANTTITDNGTQFTGKKFLNFCDDNHIHVGWSAIAHPKTNGQVERTRSNNSTKRGMWRCCGVPSTSRRYSATTTATCVLASSMSATLSSYMSKVARIDTSSRHLGKGPSLSTTCSVQEHTRSATRTGGSSPTHGTSNIYDRFTLE